MNLAFRFDIDTIQCARSGIPKLIGIAEKYNVHFTFYANMGRAIDASSVSDLFSKKSHQTNPKVNKLTVIEKLGVFSTLRTLLFNPYVGLSYSDQLHDLIKAGHELGLHGGRNHAEWQHSAQSWPDSKIRSEIEWGIKQFESKKLPRPKTFSSPGFNSPENLSYILREFGFDLMADLSDPEQGLFITERNQSDQLFYKVNTSLSGQPGSIGFLEWCKAKKLSNAEMFRVVLNKLEKDSNVIVYDHPAYVSNGGAYQLEYLINELKKRDIQFNTVSNIVHLDE